MWSSQKNMGPYPPQGVSKSNEAVYGSLLGQIMLWDRTLICHLSNPRHAEEMKSRIKKQSERRPGRSNSLQGTSLAQLLPHFCYAMGNYLLKHRQSFASLLLLFPCRSPPSFTSQASLDYSLQNVLLGAFHWCLSLMQLDSKTAC